MKPTRQQVGEAGVHWVIAQLTLRGLTALPTSRNQKGPDIVVTGPSGDTAALLSVKTRRNTSDKFWIVGDEKTGNVWGGPLCWYVFVRVTDKGRPGDPVFEALTAPADEVRRFATADREEQVRRKYRKVGGGGWGYTPFYIELFHDDQIKERAARKWKEFTV